MSGLFLDSSSIIYLIEAESSFHGGVVRRVLAHQSEPEAVLMASRLARLECRVKPLRDGDPDLLGRYDAFFAAERLVLADVSAAIIERATSLRARYGFRTPDAIHLATAIELQATAFLTGDKSLARCTDVKVEVLRG